MRQTSLNIPIAGSGAALMPLASMNVSMGLHFIAGMTTNVR